MPDELDDVKAIVTKSGNSFHCKVLKHLKSKGWTALVSPYYNDFASGKPREIDLVVEKAVKVNNTWGEPSGTVNLKLCIECKYVPNKTVFWLHNMDNHKANELITKTTPCRLDNTNTKRHHYLAGTEFVAKLFADEKSKGVENEIFFKALNQSLNSLIYYRGKASIVREQYPKIKYKLSYPIIMCNSFENLFSVHMDDEGNDPIGIENNFLLEVNYAHPTPGGADIDEYFLIDVIDFRQIDTFLDSIEEDANLAAFFCVE